MDSGIIVSLILGFASIICSIFFGFIPEKRKSKIKRLEKKVRTLAQDIDSFYAIKQSLLEQLSAATGKNSKKLKKDTRKQVKTEKGRALSSYACPSGIASDL